MLFSSLAVSLIALLVSPSWATPKPATTANDASTSIPPRYTNGLANAVFLWSVENGGVKTPPDQYEQEIIQAINGSLVFTQGRPTESCPCANGTKVFGAQNVTGYYIGGTTYAPTLQLFTSGPEQVVYVDTDLSLRYTTPGGAVPERANATSISFQGFNPQSTTGASIQGSITHADGNVTYFNNYQFCAPPGSPPRTADGVGPLAIRACKTEGNTPTGSGIVDKHCISGAFFTSTNTPEAAPYNYEFVTPSQPLVYAYTN